MRLDDLTGPHSVPSVYRRPRVKLKRWLNTYLNAALCVVNTTSHLPTSPPEVVDALCSTLPKHRAPTPATAEQRQAALDTGMRRPSTASPHSYVGSSHCRITSEQRLHVQLRPYTRTLLAGMEQSPPDSIIVRRVGPDRQQRHVSAHHDAPNRTTVRWVATRDHNIGCAAFSPRELVITSPTSGRATCNRRGIRLGMRIPQCRIAISCRRSGRQLESRGLIAPLPSSTYRSVPHNHTGYSYDPTWRIPLAPLGTGCT